MLQSRISRPSGQQWEVPGYYVFSSGDFQPKPYRRGGPESFTEMPAREYLALIHEEVRSAKAYAASIAASLGGLFITAIQVYGRIVA